MVFLETNFTFESDNATDQRHTFTTEMFGFDDIVPTTTHIVSSPDSIPAQVMNTPSLNSPLIPSPDSYSPPSNVITAPQPRRSTRGVKPPIWNKDYVTKTSSNSCLYSIASVLDYIVLSCKY